MNITLATLDNYSDLINKTYSSSRQSIEGFYYFDSLKNAVYLIIKSNFIFVSFDYSFGSRWTTQQHEIIERVRMPKSFYDYYMTCDKSQWSKLIA